MRVLVAMSGGVDSSVAAALLIDQGHDVTGVTLKLWGGESDTGCCSVSDVDDARRVAQQLGIDHHVFAFGDEFDVHVVAPYVAEHSAGRTPNPCIECNRHLKFDRLLTRAVALGFDAIATGHHAKNHIRHEGGRRVARGADRAKDQSYVLYMLGQRELARTLLPVGCMTKGDVRTIAASRGLRTATKHDSQDVCFITSTGGRRAFLERRVEMHPGIVVDTAGSVVGEVPAVELITVGQRRGTGAAGTREPRYVVDVDVTSAVVTVGTRDDLLHDSVALRDTAWADARPNPSTPVLAQCSAHGDPVPARVDGDVIRFAVPRPRVAPGQSVVLYDGDEVVGGGIAV
jgi:tRNA-specific 2-thiouridylase